MLGLVCPLDSTDKDGLQIAGGINPENALLWIERGASKVVVTSYLFPDAKFSIDRLIVLEKLVGKERLVVDVRYIFFNKIINIVVDGEMGNGGLQ
jgi:hypothetical protein